MKPVFISYKRDNFSIVKTIISRLQSEVGDIFWYDMEGIDYDIQFISAICKAIDECEIVLFMYSKHHLNIKNFEKDYTIKELRYAIGENKKIILINTDNTNLKGYFKFEFDSLNYVTDFNDPIQYGKLIKELQPYRSSCLSFQTAIPTHSEKKHNTLIRQNNRICVRKKPLYIKEGVIYESATNEPYTGYDAAEELGMDSKRLMLNVKYGIIYELYYSHANGNLGLVYDRKEIGEDPYESYCNPNGTIVSRTFFLAYNPDFYKITKEIEDCLPSILWKRNNYIK